MKKTQKILNALFLVVILFSAKNIEAQAPQKMSYQAVVRNTKSDIVASKQISLRISILQGAADGSVLYSENQSPNTNVNGLISIEIGNSVDFDKIDWSKGPFFIKTEVDPDGAENYTMVGTSQLLSVPYALHAKTAETITGNIQENDPNFTSSQAANITATDITKLSNLSGVNTGDQDLSGLATSAALIDSTTSIRAAIPDVSGFATQSDLSNKVDKETGKGLSTEDYTTTDKAKVANLSGVNTGDQDLSGLATKKALEDSIGQVRSEIPTGISDLTLNANLKNITSLADPVNAQDAATKAYVDALEAQVATMQDILITAGLDPTKVKDIDGNIYEVVKIGSQYWMAGNLKVTKYSNGDEIGTTSPATKDISGESTPKYQWAYDGSESNVNTYGRLYTWYVVTDSRNVCPTGWHIPSDGEFATLSSYLGGNEISGEKLKSSSGFNALLGGRRLDNGDFSNLFVDAFFWTTTEYDLGTKWAGYRLLDNYITNFDPTVSPKSTGMSVRCLKD